MRNRGRGFLTVVLKPSTPLLRGLLLLVTFLLGVVAWGQSTAFTYQGALTDQGAPAEGSYTITFRLFDAALGGNAIGAPITESVPVSKGLFAVRLDFGPNSFPGGARFVEVTVNGVTLAPRQEVMASPYAITAFSIVDRAVTTPKLADSAVTTIKLADLAVIAAKIADAAIVGPKIAAGAVTSDKIAVNAVNAGHLARDEDSLNKVSGGTLTARSGMVGVGVAQPGAPLDIMGQPRLRGLSTENPGIRLYYADRDRGFIGFNADGKLGLLNRQDGTGLFLNVENGFVGVNKPRPVMPLDVAGNSLLGGDTTIRGNLVVDGTVRSGGNAFFQGDLSIAGDGGITGDVTISGNATVVRTLNVGGDLNVAGRITGQVLPNGPAGGDLGGSYPNPVLRTDESLLAKVSGGALMAQGGQIGLGVSSPSSRLDLMGRVRLRSQGNTRPGIWLYYGDQDRGFIGGTPDGKIGLMNRDVDGTGIILNVETGHVGIGTNTPVSRLHVVGDSLFAGNLRTQGTMTAEGTLRSTADTAVGRDLSVAGNAGITGNATVSGTTNVARDLNVGGNLNVEGRIRGVGEFPPVGPAGGDLTGGYPNPLLRTDPILLAKVSGGVAVSANGRIGIGTTTPTSLLTVQGPIESRQGGIVFPDGTIQRTSAENSAFTVEAFGAVGDGVTDDAPAIQRALNAAWQAGGARVLLGAKTYRLNQPITIGAGVTLAGTWEGPHFSFGGTLLLATANEGQETGPALISIQPNGTLRGVTVFYPNQRLSGGNVIPYPWTIRAVNFDGRATNFNVMDVTLVNPYRGIDVGSQQNELHFISNVYGCPLKEGIFIGFVTDVGRVENVHFNPNFWALSRFANSPASRELVDYLNVNLTGFTIGRSDWQILTNTFCYGAAIGYRFIGECNGTFTALYADRSTLPLLVENSYPQGLLFLGAKLVGNTRSRAIVEVRSTNTGMITFSNSAFWGSAPLVAYIEGRGRVVFNSCNFESWTSRDHALQIEGGSIDISHCNFWLGTPHIRLGPGIASATIVGNTFAGTPTVLNQSSAPTYIVGNIGRSY